jgi:NTE family protein
MRSMRNKKLGLALGGGGLLGVSHIGVLEILEENDIRPGIITGTSAGSVVAALYAAGVRTEAMRLLANSLPKEKLFDFNFSRLTYFRMLMRNICDLIQAFDLLPRGLINGVKIEDYISRETRNKTLSQVGMPLGIVATDLINGQRVVFTNRPPLMVVAGTCYYREAPLGLAVRASSAIPGAFEPVRFRDNLLVDGGLLEMVPAPLARQLGARRVIAVSLGARGPTREPVSLVQVIMRSINVMSDQSTNRGLDAADLVLKPEAPEALEAGLSDYQQIPELLESGRKAAQDLLPELCSLSR